MPVLDSFAIVVTPEMSLVSTVRFPVAVILIVSILEIVGLIDSPAIVTVNVSLPAPPSRVSTVSSEPAVVASNVSSPEPVVKVF